MFNIVLDEQRENDIVEKVKDITFLIDKSLIEDFEGFKITCTSENGKGLMLEPLKNIDGGGGCSTCGGGCH